MLIDELLYHLHHPESLDQFDEQTLKNLIHQYPYLESLKSVYFKKSGLSASMHQDLHEKLKDLTQVQFENHPGEMMTGTVFDLHTQNAVKASHSELDASKKDQNEGVDIRYEPLSQATPSYEFYADMNARDQSGLPISTYPLYAYDESDFVQYLNTLSPCKVPQEYSNEDHDQTKERITHSDDLVALQMEKTAQLIASSVDLREDIGSESLANLWAEQGKPDLAIQIYEKLIVTNPEKRSIFAAKIAKLKADFSL
jgi:hypothetical protein